MMYHGSHHSSAAQESANGAEESYNRGEKTKEQEKATEALPKQDEGNFERAGDRKISNVFGSARYTYSSLFYFHLPNA